MLRTALGSAIAGHLDDPSIVEVMLNPGKLPATLAVTHKSAVLEFCA